MNNYIFPFLWMRDQSEEVLRQEIARIDECGIKAVCLESRPHPDFAGPGWWHDFDIVLEEAHRRGMKIWILDDAHFPTGQANGMIPARHPELARRYVMMQHTDCVGPVPQATLDVGLFMTKAFTWMDFGKPVNKPLRSDTRLLSVMAYPVVEGDTLAEEGVDLTGLVRDGQLTWDVPAGVWRVCVSFVTSDFGARNEYINYLDAASVRVLLDAIYEPHYARYAGEFGKTIAGFFSDEPGFYNVDDFQMNDAIGTKKMALPWSDELESRMEQQYASDWKQTLPLLWMPSREGKRSSLARLRYMDLASRLYSQNFSCQLGSWCEAHGVEYIGHVIEDNGEHCRLGCGAGHYFRAMAGQHMAGIDTIGGQILPGNPYASRHGVAYVAKGTFNHFGLAKLGASAAQIDPKKKGRLMCEAFGAYGWGFGVRNMQWLVDYLLAQGVNRFVPHAFSMAEYPDCDCPPHFYARGNNPEFRWFADVMKYANRMCGLLDGGQNVPVAGMLYPAESDWMGPCMPVEDPGRVLQENQIDYEILPLDVLRDKAAFGTRLRDGVLTVNGRDMKALLLPGAETVSRELAVFLDEAGRQGLPMAWLGRRPTGIAGADPERDAAPVAAVSAIPVVSLQELPAWMKAHGLCEIRTDRFQPALLSYHYRKEEELYFFFNTSLSETVETVLSLPLQEELVVYDAASGKRYRPAQQRTADGVRFPLVLAPYAHLLLTTNRAGQPVECPAGQPDGSWHTRDLSEDWRFSCARAIDYPRMGAEETLQTLEPVSRRMPRFSGIMRYRKTLQLDEAPAAAWFRAEHVYEVAEVFVNGVSAGRRVTPGYAWEIGALLHPGQNEITVEVANTPQRDSLNRPGIFGPDREMMEPAGMFGKIVLQWK